MTTTNSPSSPALVPKLWGHERILHNDYDYCMKELTLNAGYRSSLHKHNRKRETFLVVAGKVVIEQSMENGLIASELTVGEYVTIEPGTYHRFWSLAVRSVVVEASMQHKEEDVYRLVKSQSYIKLASAPTGSQATECSPPPQPPSNS